MILGDFAAIVKVYFVLFWFTVLKAAVERPWNRGGDWCDGYKKAGVTGCAPATSDEERLNPSGFTFRQDLVDDIRQSGC